MNQRTKKKLIAALLLAACVFSAWLLFTTPDQESRTLVNLHQADSLIYHTFAEFDIPRNAISRRTTTVDSSFQRITYRTSVPPGFPKTQFHAAMKQILLPYRISLPARVVFPDKDMHIYLQYHHTIVRTVQLQTE